MKKTFILFVASLCLSSFLLGYQLTPASAIETNLVAQHWLILINKIPFQNKDGEYQIMGLEHVVYKGQLLCEIYHLDPHGHIVVSSYKELSPLISFSIVSDFYSKSSGYELMVMEELKNAIDYLEIYKEGNEKSIEAAINENRENWNRPLLKELNDVKIQKLGFNQEEEKEIDKVMKEKSANWNRPLRIELDDAEVQDSQSAQEEEERGIMKFALKERDVSLTAVTASPLLKTKWDQGFPFNKRCPLLSNEKSYVGCTATALAQIVRFYKWPKKGKGSYSYWWSKGGRRLNATFSDSYDWDYMPNLTGDYDSEREKDAVAELSYEVGVSVDMDYSPEGSGADLRKAPYALRTFFKYKPGVRTIYRYYYSYNRWFGEMKKQRNLLRPVALAIYKNINEGHAVVVDGYFISGNTKTVHINMGWAGSYDAYYSLNKILNYSLLYWSYAVINIIPDAARIQLNKTKHSFKRMEGLSNPAPKYFDIKNSAGGSLSYKMTPDKSWITTRPKSGISYGEWDTIKVSVDISSLVEGRYNGKINISSDDADNSPQVFHINLHVKRPPIHPPQNFSGVQVENRSLSQVEYINSLSWEKNPQNRNIEKYLIFLLEGNEYTALAELDANTFKYWHRRVSRDMTYR